MKKIMLLLTISVLILTGCKMANTPTSIVENVLMKYQRVDDDISRRIDNILLEQNLTDDHAKRYRKLLTDQYNNLAYEIKDETIDGNTAIVTVEIEVTDYKKAIADLTFDSSVYTKESYDEEKLSKLEASKDKVVYTLELTLNKDRDGVWRLAALTNEQIKKIQGMY